MLVWRQVDSLPPTEWLRQHVRHHDGWQKFLPELIVRAGRVLLPAVACRSHTLGCWSATRLGRRKSPSAWSQSPWHLGGKADSAKPVSSPTSRPRSRTYRSAPSSRTAWGLPT